MSEPKIVHTVNGGIQRSFKYMDLIETLYWCIENVDLSIPPRNWKTQPFGSEVMDTTVRLPSGKLKFYPTVEQFKQDYPHLVHTE